jgi:cytochrome c peroxidase
MVFPKNEIDEVKKQEGRDLTRFDLDFDLPDHLMPEFPPAVFLTTRPDLGDVSQGKLVTLTNYYELFNGILNPKQIEGMRLLLTPFPQQQFNQTEDRRTEVASRGVACLDCHSNGSTNGAAHLVGDQRPQWFRRRIETPALRGLYAQRSFGSQRALTTVEDFTEFEQRAAYFDGDPVIATKKGVNILERGSQVHFMAEMQKIFDFPPAPKLRVADGRLDPSKATPAELRGQDVFFGKGQCASCHTAPFYTDNDARPEAGAFLQAGDGQWGGHERRRPDQDVGAARGQGHAALHARRTPAHARRHRRVLQHRAGDQVDRYGEEGSGGVHANLVAARRYLVQHTKRAHLLRQLAAEG